MFNPPRKVWIGQEGATKCNQIGPPCLERLFGRTRIIAASQNKHAAPLRPQLTNDLVPLRVVVFILHRADDGGLDKMEVRQPQRIQVFDDIAERFVGGLVAHAHKSPHRRKAYPHPLRAYFICHRTGHLQ
ncbi:hypothetical protein D3C87_1638260 [compost metagenome]